MKQKNFAIGILVLFILLAMSLIVSCGPIFFSPPEITERENQTISIGNVKTNELQATQEIKKFSSVQEIRDFLKNAEIKSRSTRTYYRGGIRGGILKQSVLADVAPQTTVQARSAETSASATEYSKTNIQVEGVDEPDFVKNDDKYIYVISQDNLVIVNAFPADKAEILSKTKLQGRPRNMFVNKDRLAVFADDNEEVYALDQYDFIPRPRQTATTHIFIYDISDRKNPKLVKDYNTNGQYFESRMIDDYVYFIAKDYVYYYNGFVDVPVIKEASKNIIKPDVYYFDNPEDSYTFHTIASFNIFDEKDNINAKSFMMGQSNNLYVSQNNIYITYQKNMPYIYYANHNEERFFDVVVPLLPSDAKDKINEVKNDAHINSNERWDKLSAILEDAYNKMGKNERESLFDKIQQAIDEYETRSEIDRRKTVIQKIKIGNGAIEYVARGEVSGYLLNQFSMDEFNNYFRVATTTEIYRRFGASMYNNVYTLDDKLKIVGKIEAIAPDERIYSTRFIGNRLYMVTFKRVDPLFVVDLSNPEKPEILGKLKIPGFSDYLHPYDENHIIGLGKETESNEWGGISTNGLKLALFDVTDVSNPKQIDKYEIGEAGTDSEALRDHKAFLFDKEKNVLVIPVTEVKEKLYYDSRLGYYRQKYWQGAYVFGVTPKDGFKLKGKITHNEVEEEQNYYYYGSPNAVRRALYMDDVLFTVSAIKVKANDINNIAKELNSIELPYEKAKYYDYYWE